MGLGLVGCESAQILSFSEAKNLVMHKKLDDSNIQFDVPITYMENYRQGTQWIIPAAKPLEKIGLVDAPIRLTGILPDLAPYSEANAFYFNIPGPGIKVDITLSNPGEKLSWNEFFMNELKTYALLPYDPAVPDMPRYIDYHRHRVLYLSSDKSSPDMVLISCGYYNEAVIPECEGKTLYRGLYQLTYKFHKKYLKDWVTIDTKSKALLNRLATDPKDVSQVSAPPA